MRHKTLLIIILIILLFLPPVASLVYNATLVATFNISALIGTDVEITGIHMNGTTNIYMLDSVNNQPTIWILNNSFYNLSNKTVGQDPIIGSTNDLTGNETDSWFISETEEKAYDINRSGDNITQFTTRNGGLEYIALAMNNSNLFFHTGTNAPIYVYDFLGNNLRNYDLKGDYDGSLRGLTTINGTTFWFINMNELIVQADQYGNITAIMNISHIGTVSDTNINAITTNNGIDFYLSDFATDQIYHISFDIIPLVDIMYPENTAYSTSIRSLNYTISTGGTLNNCWYSLDNGLTNNTVTCNENISGLNSGEGNFNWTVYGNNTDGNIGKDTVYFTVAFTPPNVTSNYPPDNQMLNYTDNIPLNWTATDANGISACQIYHDGGGSWQLNTTRTDITSAIEATQLFNFSDGNITYNIWCNDTTNLGNWSTKNYTFTIDTINPIINTISITTTQGSQTVPFNVTSYTELYCNQTFYSVYKADGSIEGSLNNISTSCTNFGDTFVVSAYATYNLTVYMRDKAGHLGFKSQQFTTTATPMTPTGGNTGGGKASVITINPASNFSILTFALGNKLDFVLALGSVKPREKEFILINTGINPLEVKLTCDTTSLSSNESTEEGRIIDICRYVEFDKDTLSVSPNELEPTRGKIFITTPQNASFEDTYTFNIIATVTKSETLQEYAKLSVVTRVPLWALIYKWSYAPFQEDAKDEEKSQYPVLFIALLLSFVVFIIIFLTLKSRFPLSSVILRLSFMLLSFMLWLYLL